MAKPSIYIPDELLEDFDEQIWEDKQDGAIPRDMSRSKVIRELIRGYVEGNSDSRSTGQPMIVMTTMT